MEGRDWAIVFATLFGPIFAVQVQKRIEILRERRQRKLLVFATLMTTRGARVSPDHVRALNMIDTVFDGGTLFGIRRVKKSDKAVLDAWHQYLDHLNTSAEQVGLPVWQATGESFFV